MLLRERLTYMSDFSLLMAKYHTHCCQFTNRKPPRVAFIGENKQNVHLIQLFLKPKAIRTISAALNLLCSYFSFCSMSPVYYFFDNNSYI